MSIQNGKIVAPVTVSDVKSTLGESVDTVGKLCSSAKINKWSLRKPVSFGGLVVDRSTQWWRGANGLCGFNLSKAQVTAYAQIPSKYTADGVNGWEYQQPSGGEGSPYRLGDFIGYRHDAQPMIADFNVTSRIEERELMVSSIAVNGGGLTLEDHDNVQMLDITIDTNKTLNDYFFGVVVTDASGNVKGRVTSSKAGVRNCAYDTNGLAMGMNNTYRVYPFFSKVQMAQASPDVASIFYTVPGVTFKTFNILSYQDKLGLTIKIDCAYGYVGTTVVGIDTKLTLSCKEGSVKLTNNVLQYRYANSEDSDPIAVPEKAITLQDYTVDTIARQYTLDYFFINSAYNTKEFKAILTFDGGKIRKEVQPTKKLV